MQHALHHYNYQSNICFWVSRLMIIRG